MNDFLFEVKQTVVTLIRLFYALLNNGNQCIVCGKKTFCVPLCKSCLEKHYSVKNAMSVKRCKCCGRELISSDEDCLICREKPVLVHADYVCCMFSYRLWNKELMFKWKILGERAISAVFAKLVAQALETLNIDIVVPVPPRKGKIQKNGWDQIDELCQFLEKRHGFKVLRLLERHSVVQQKKLNREERLDSIKNAYSMKNDFQVSKALKPFSGKIPEKVCLLDDVCTTGSTLECCSQILKEAGIQNINVLTLFIVD